MTSIYTSSQKANTAPQGFRGTDNCGTRKETPMSDTASTNVFDLDDIVWHETELGAKFWISDNLVSTEYSKLFSAQMTKFGPGGGSSPHQHDYNHAFYFLSGTGRLLLGGQTMETKPGTFAKIPANIEHGLTNIGDDDLVFLVIYDPPHVATD
jgi:quercetin dioxygenase-like cupin family protein